MSIWHFEGLLGLCTSILYVNINIALYLYLVLIDNIILLLISHNIYHETVIFLLLDLKYEEYVFICELCT